jgi:hypothetical protein
MTIPQTVREKRCDNQDAANVIERNRQKTAFLTNRVPACLVIMDTLRRLRLSATSRLATG